MWLDTVTNPVSGKYSMKRLMMWVTFHVAIIMCIAASFEIHTDPKFRLATKADTPTDVIALLLLYAFGLSANTIAGQYFNRTTADNNGAPLTPPFNPSESPITE